MVFVFHFDTFQLLLGFKQSLLALDCRVIDQNLFGFLFVFYILHNTQVFTSIICFDYEPVAQLFSI